MLMMMASFSTLTYGQQIRKNYTELTPGEKQRFITRLKDAYDPSIKNIATSYAIWNNKNWSLIHYNESFLPWYRWFLVNFEKAAWLTLPYWDWRIPTEQLPTAALWNNDFLGSFDNPANPLYRTFTNKSNGHFLTFAESDQLLQINSYSDYWNALVNQAHMYPPEWVGGAMVTTTAPRDPSFFLHHAMIDKLWNDWTRAGHTSTYGRSTMLIADTYISNTQTVDINYASNLENFNVWYTENGQLNLDHHIVKNTARELFSYIGIVSAGDDFIVPASTSCDFASSQKIIFGKGFRAEKGSKFTARIMPAAIFDNVSAPVPQSPETKGPQQQSETAQVEDLVMVSPNPSTGHFLVGVAPHLEYEYFLTDAMGAMIKKSDSSSSDLLQLDLTGHAAGIYVLKLMLSDGNTVVKRLSLQ